MGVLPSDTSFRPANEGVRRIYGTRRGRSSSEGGGRRRRAGKTFHHSNIRARSFGRTCCFRSGQESSYYAFLANENVRALYPLFLLPTLPRQTSGYSNARTISGTLGFDWSLSQPESPTSFVVDLFLFSFWSYCGDPPSSVCLQRLVVGC